MDMITRRTLLFSAAAVPLAARARADAPPGWAESLTAAARTQIGVTVHYDPQYTAIPYPMGDVPRDRGVCTDVVIRAYRDSLGRDLQQLVHEDMKANFGKYPKGWGLSRPDPNIDHRRVGNLRTFLDRQGATLPHDDASLFEAGDIVTMTVPPNLPHIAIVDGGMAGDGLRPLIVHNIGQGTQREDRLGEFPLTGRYRWAG